jgi:hypothetical protein
MTEYFNVLASVYAANNNQPIPDATFSCDYSVVGDDFYYLTYAVNQTVAVSAPNYQTAYVINPGEVYLTYIGAWPQTY